MVKHIVLFRFTSLLNEDDRELRLKMMEETFSGLKEKLPYILEYRTGRNFTPAGHAWDFAIDSAFGSAEDLIRYQESPEHRDAVRKAEWIAKEKAVVDYEY